MSFSKWGQNKNIIMTPTHTPIPLRKSKAGTFRPEVDPSASFVNDDEEERRQRRKNAIEKDLSTINESAEHENLKKCLKIVNENKLSKDNAFQLNLIDTLRRLVERHHNSLSDNFKWAGTSLEASSKVYGIRVDAVHTDVIRMSAGLNKKRFAGRSNDDEDGDTGTNDQQQSQNSSNTEQQNVKDKPKRKRVRRNISTITKNKDTINGKLDTIPLSDPVFAKLNTISGNINSANRLLQNILPSIDSEIKMKLNYKFWDSTPSTSTLADDQFCPEEILINDESIPHLKFENFNNINLDEAELRISQNGYKILDIPAEYDNDDQQEPNLPPIDDFPQNASHLAMAFDINAEIEQNDLNAADGFIDVDICELNDLNADEQAAIVNCRGLRRKPVSVDNMRPIDGTSLNLEYSYRPINKISQFWAGPSHWKFRKSTTIGIRQSQILTHGTKQSTQHLQKQKVNNLRKKNKVMLAENDLVTFDNDNDHFFIPNTAKNERKIRKVNTKSWDAAKLKLPEDLHLEDDFFETYVNAPNVQRKNLLKHDYDDDEYEENDSQNEYADNYGDMQMEDHNHMDIDHAAANDNEMQADIPAAQGEIPPSQNVGEIGTEFIGAPEKIKKVIVPFAKRAKIIDMKQLKRCCAHSIKTQFAFSKENNAEKDTNGDNSIRIDENDGAISTNNENLDKLKPHNPIFQNEEYKTGIADFKKTYTELPNILSRNMKESLSTSLAFYSILHLANESNLRLIPQDDLENFKILQLENNESSENSENPENSENNKKQ